MTVHEFDPARAGEHDGHEWWGRWYPRAFVGYVTHDLVTEVTLQKAGIDHRVHLSGGGEVLVDVKCRCEQPQFRSDILVEVWSDKARKVPGWGRKPLRCHYIAYAWPQLDVGYLIPFNLLRLAYERHKQTWKDAGFATITAENRRYDTVSVAVPWDRLLADVAGCMTVYVDPAMEPFA